LKKILYISTVFAGVLLLTGCNAAKQGIIQPKPQIIKEKISEEHIYQIEPNIKKAIVILIKKIDALEKQNGYNTREAKQIKKEINKISSKDNGKFKKEIEDLREKIAELEKKIKTKNKSFDSKKFCKKTILYKIDGGFYKALKDAQIRPCPSYDSSIVGIIKNGTIVRFEGCNDYGWCLLKGRRGYVAGFLFKKISKTDEKPAKNKISKNINEYEKIIKEYVEGK